MKTNKKKTLRNKADKLVGASVRSLGYCEICGKTQELQWCHFITRGCIKLRYEPKNNACLCAGCHFHGHDDPKWMTVQWDKIKGRGATSFLSKESNILIPITHEFYLDIIKKYEQGI